MVGEYWNTQGEEAHGGHEQHDTHTVACQVVTIKKVENVTREGLK